MLLPPKHWSETSIASGANCRVLCLRVSARLSKDPRRFLVCYCHQNTGPRLPSRPAQTAACSACVSPPAYQKIPDASWCVIATKTLVRDFHRVRRKLPRALLACLRPLIKRSPTLLGVLLPPKHWSETSIASGANCRVLCLRVSARLSKDSRRFLVCYCHQNTGPVFFFTSNEILLKNRCFSAISAAKRRRFFSTVFQQFSPRSGGIFFSSFSASFRREAAKFFSNFELFQQFFSNFQHFFSELVFSALFQQFSPRSGELFSAIFQQFQQFCFRSPFFSSFTETLKKTLHWSETSIASGANCRVLCLRVSARLSKDPRRFLVCYCHQGQGEEKGEGVGRGTSHDNAIAILLQMGNLPPPNYHVERASHLFDPLVPGSSALSSAGARGCITPFLCCKIRGRPHPPPPHPAGLEPDLRLQGCPPLRSTDLGHKPLRSGRNCRKSETCRGGGRPQICTKRSYSPRSCCSVTNGPLSGENAANPPFVERFYYRSTVVIHLLCSAKGDPRCLSPSRCISSSTMRVLLWIGLWSISMSYGSIFFGGGGI